MSSETETWAIAETLASGAAQQIGAANRTEVIGGSSRLLAAADQERYTAGLSVGRSRKVISLVIQNLI